MTTVGVRELKEQASELLRRVREDGETIEITYRGRLSARLVPVVPLSSDADDIHEKIISLDQLAAQIGQKWQDADAEDAMHETRRSL